MPLNTQRPSETRADALEATSLHGFLDGLVAEWRRTRAAALEFRREVPDVPILADTAGTVKYGDLIDGEVLSSRTWSTNAGASPAAGEIISGRTSSATSWPRHPGVASTMTRATA